MAALSNSEFLLANDGANDRANDRASEQLGAIAPLPPDAPRPPKTGPDIADLVDMRSTVLSLQALIRQAVQVMQGQGLSCVAVVEKGQILGLFTEQQVIDAVAAGLDPALTSLGLSRLLKVPTVRSSDSLGTWIKQPVLLVRRYSSIVARRHRRQSSSWL